MDAKGKILIIDDNEDVLFALNLLLEPYVEKIKTSLCGYAQGSSCITVHKHLVDKQMR